MALDLTGIENVEFYSGHYLDALLESDLKDVFGRWTKQSEEDGKKHPAQLLGGLATAWFRAKSQGEEERDPTARWTIAREFHAHLIEALGYEYRPSVEPLDGDEYCPVLYATTRAQQSLWIVDAPFRRDSEEEPLDAPLLAAQFPDSAGLDSMAVLPRSADDRRKALAATWRELLDTRIFRLEHGPRWVLFLGGDEIVLAERNKWPAGKLLRFDLGEIFARKDKKTLQAVCGLIHRDSLAPEEGLCLHDTLEENSHKHAFAVSGDLKHGVRRSVELLANEAVWYRREKQRKGVFNEEELAAGLERDCLTWLYRLLFLFYVEARGSELGVVPMKADAYRAGYSLETLRELELVPLTTEKARDGYYLDHSLKLLFRIVNEGFPDTPLTKHVFDFEGEGLDAMRISALRSPLFDDDRLQILKGVKFRNHVLQKILQLLSLSAEKKGKKKSRGRISYAQLGINQLGAVYEGLLSYTGFFATEDLYEVASEKDCKQLSGKPSAEREALKTYFVPASRIEDYKDGEIVRDENNKKVVHEKGAFIFRLAGRNREKSASYYTPEVLTRCLVKYALKELLWEEDPESGERLRKKSADEILSLTICEPAMGSSAFLIEAVDQLADAYLEARQEEVKASGGETIPPENYQREKRRVKARLATNNCYGVDLNPTAVELAKVSLWLATLHEDGKCPWFGLRLATGNSLVGARREVFKTADVIRKGTRDNPNWLGTVPEPVPLHHSPEEGGDAPGPDGVDWANWTAPPRPKGTIYHFLLPAEGMAAFDTDKGKVIKQLAPESVKRIKEWRKEFCKPFNKKDGERLEQISDAVDRLLAQVVRERVLATQETSDRIPVWGEPPSAQQADLLVRDQEEVAASLEDGSSAYRRLKLAMDAWCALWFWPIEEAELLPDRATWLAQMELILKGRVTHEEVLLQQGLFAALAPTKHPGLVKDESPSRDLVPQSEASAERLKRLLALSDAFGERRAGYLEECGLADIDVVIAGDASLRTAQGIAERLQFCHWNLRFAEVFAVGDGFDLILGNPPWIKLSWKSDAVLADANPLLDLRSFDDVQQATIAADLLGETHCASSYLEEFESTTGQQAFLGCHSLYPLLTGLQTNLYKAFIAVGLRVTSTNGLAALIHQKGAYDESKGQGLRKALYPRLRALLQFSNKRHLFEDVKDSKYFDVSVLASVPKANVGFWYSCNLFHPKTLDESFAHDGLGPVPGIKTEDDNWELAGHRSRIVQIGQAQLNLFAQLFDEAGTSDLAARLPMAHSKQVVAVLARLAQETRSFGDHDLDRRYVSEHLHESRRQKDGTIRRQTHFPSDVEHLIYQGPHFWTASPVSATPNENCRHHQDYSDIDLEAISDDYLPRTNYAIACDRAAYLANAPVWHGQPVLEKYRHVHRQMISIPGERSLVSAIIPPGVGHVDSVFAVALQDLRDLLRLSAVTASLPADFFVKALGKGSVRNGEIDALPFMPPLDSQETVRILRLQVITNSYRELWEASYSERFQVDAPTLADVRLPSYAYLSKNWNHETPFRSALARRRALLELDVLVSMKLRISLDELISIYRIQFPVFRQRERERQYDQSGRIVPNAATFLGESGVPLRSLALVLREQAGFDVHAEYHPDGRNTQELRKQKIRLGKKEADVLGVSERCTMADILAETEVRWSDEDHPEGRPVRLVGLRYTDPGLEPRMERVYPTPWTRCDREADYRQAWAEFERRLGKKMPEGTPLTEGEARA